MDLIPQFIARYTKEYDFYEQACRMAAQLLEVNLQTHGVRAIVTSRAKNPLRLEDKVQQRAKEHNYQTVDEIYDDIVDLAGVRVALYFPAERLAVERIIQSLFVSISPPKVFPIKGKPTYDKRFSGYWATHYRVHLPESRLDGAQKRYSEARLEIQVASVLMHAWSEVEHDLVYKPLQGDLSEDEYAILDELNGMVLAGEIALERLQRATQVRVSARDREYANLYDLASSLIELSRTKFDGQTFHDSSIGRVDLLFLLLQKLKLNTPEKLSNYIDALHSDLEKRPLAEQVIDQILAEDPDRYLIYGQIRTTELSPLAFASGDSSRTSQNEAIGEFIKQWMVFEKIIDAAVQSSGQTRLSVPPTKALSLISQQSSEFFQIANRLRKFRNILVHGIEAPDADYIRGRTKELQHVIENINKHQDVQTKPAKIVQRVTKKQ